MHIPKKLQPGDEIRVVAPATSMVILDENQRKTAIQRLEELGLKVTFGKHVEEANDFHSSNIASRVEDLHDAFRDPNVKGILTVIGGFNSNQLLQYLDYELIKNNPKILCGFSDITALSTAIYAKTGLVTYSGPHFSTFSMLKGIEYTRDNLKKCLMSEEPYEIEPADYWSDDAWYMDQENRNFLQQDDFDVIRNGTAEGQLIGGNLCTLNLLQGTEYMPSLKEAILFLEDDYMTEPALFDRDLQSLLHLPDADQIRGLVIGRFQKKSEMAEEILKKVLETKNELKNIPIITNVNFGHTQPITTFPIGGRVQLTANENKATIKIIKH
ncbi:S66 family peptidase [Pseudalkalibacillus sp. Hm43]|uniref:S66 family peptidase n=1 Tax=Pseudalkalibacillus sp. Hm43 TaxID=3450742 RepID=UPI003F429912